MPTSSDAETLLSDAGAGILRLGYRDTEDPTFRDLAPGTELAESSPTPSALP